MTTLDKRYVDQVRLLVSVLPHVAQEPCFALKGGTAINLFIRDLPRLSADIDLAYLPVEDHETSRRGIDAALRRIRERVTRTTPACGATLGSSDGTGPVDTLGIHDGAQAVKVEPR